MSSTDGLHGRLDVPPPDDLGIYRAISTLAVASSVVGAASAAALIGVPLWIVPLVGILLSCLALFRIDHSSGTLVGRPLALAGLGLAVCFGSAALAAHFNSQYLLKLKAQEVAGQWFQALAQGEPEVAHQWTIAPVYRADPPDLKRLKSYYADDKPRGDRLASFAGQGPIAILLRLGTRAHVEPQSAKINRIDDQLEFVSLVYRVTSYAAAGPAPFLIELTLEERRIPGRPQPRWTVRSWKFDGPEPAMPVD